MHKMIIFILSLCQFDSCLGISPDLFKTSAMNSFYLYAFAQVCLNYFRIIERIYVHKNAIYFILSYYIYF